MRAIRTRPIYNLPPLGPLPSGAYGSTVAGQFLQDAKAGRDSLDIVVIGDSNAGQGSNYGYTAGLDRALGYGMGIPNYATPLSPGSIFSSGTVSNGIAGNGVSYIWNADNTAGNSGTIRTIVGAAASADTEATALKNYLGFSSSLGAEFLGKTYTGAFVASGVTFTSGGNNTSCLVLTGNSMVNNDASNFTLNYRMVYGTFATGSGKFKLSAWQVGVAITADAAYRSTNTGTVGYATTTVPLSVARSSTVQLYFGFDGFTQGATYYVTGPFANLWHSVSKASTIGYCVNQLVYTAGASTSNIADRVEGMDKLLDCYLKELRERQIASGGTGRVLVWLNSGINGPDTGTSWTTNAARIRDRIVQRWTATGGSPSTLAFVMSVTHPVYTALAGNTWLTSRAAVASAASTWATNNAGDGNNVTVVDIATPYPSWKLNLGSIPFGSMYDSGSTQAHLNYVTNAQQNGYDAVAAAVLNAAMASV